MSNLRYYKTLIDLHISLSIVRIKKARSLRWVRSVAGMGRMRDPYITFWGDDVLEDRDWKMEKEVR